MKRVFAIVSLILVLPVLASAQRFDREHLSVAAGARFNHVLNNGHHDIYGRLVSSYDSPGAEIELGIDTHPSDSSWWANAYNFPHLALGFSWNNTGSLRFKNNSRLGDFFNVYAKAQIDLVRAGFFSFGPFLQVGAAYTPFKYNYFSNPACREIGSNVEGLIGAGIDFKFQILPQWELSVNAALTHHSNGMTGVPNVGLNEVSATARVRYFFSPVPSIRRERGLPRPEFPKGLHFNVHGYAGVHACDVERRAVEKLYENGQGKIRGGTPAPPRFRGGLGVELTYRYAPVFSSGLGVEAHYADNQYRVNDLVLKGEEDPRGYSPFYVTAYIIQEFHYNRLSLHVMFGMYVFKKTGLTEDIPLTYQKIGLRYNIPHCRGLYLSFDMRAHNLDRSYCLEPGLGYTF